MKNDPHRRYYRHNDDRYIVEHIFHSASSSDLRRLSSRLRSIMQFNCAKAMMNIMKSSSSSNVMFTAYCGVGVASVMHFWRACTGKSYAIAVWTQILYLGLSPRTVSEIVRMAKKDSRNGTNSAI